MYGIINMIYFAHLCWLLSSVISAAFTPPGTVSTSSMIFRSPEDPLGYSEKTLQHSASESTTSSPPPLSLSALSNSVKPQPPVSPTPTDTADLSSLDITIHLSSEDSQQTARVSIKSLSSSSVSSSFFISGSLGSLISPPNTKKAVMSDLSASVMAQIEPFSSGVIFSANVLRTVGSATNPTEEHPISPSATESMSRPVASGTPYEIMSSPIRIDEDSSSGFSSFTQTHQTGSAIQYSTMDKLMEAAFSLMSSSPFSSLAVTSSTLASVMDSLSVSSVPNSQKPSDILSIDESVLGGTLQNTDSDTNIFKETQIPPSLSTSDSASSELSSFEEINSLSQESILTAVDTIIPTSSGEYLYLSGTVELMSVYSEFSTTNGEANITPSLFELNFGSVSGDESTTITFVDSFSSGKTILPEASTFVSNTVLEETSSSETWSVSEKDWSITPREKFTDPSSLYTGEKSVISTNEMISSSLTYHALQYGSSTEDNMVSENLSSDILSTSLDGQAMEVTTAPISIVLPSERLSDEHHSPSQYENSFSREQTPHFFFSSEASTHNQEITSISMLNGTITESMSPASVEDTTNQFESLTVSASLLSSEETLKASASSPVSTSGIDVSSVENMTLALPVVSLYGDIWSTPQTELIEKTHFWSSPLSSTLPASVTGASLVESLSPTAKHTILTEETTGFVSSVQLASTLYESSTPSSVLTIPQGEQLPETFSIISQIVSSSFDTLVMQSSSTELPSVSFEFETTVLPSSFSEIDASALESAVIPSSSLEISSIETVDILATSSELSSLDTVVWHYSSSETSALDIVRTPRASSELTSMDTLVTQSSSLEVITTMVEHSLSSFSSVEKVVPSSFLSFQPSPQQTETAVVRSLSSEFSSPESVVNYLSYLDSFSLGTAGKSTSLSKLDALGTVVQPFVSSEISSLETVVKYSSPKEVSVWETYSLASESSSLETVTKPSFQKSTLSETVVQFPISSELRSSSMDSSSPPDLSSLETEVQSVLSSEASWSRALEISSMYTVISNSLSMRVSSLEGVTTVSALPESSSLETARYSFSYSELSLLETLIQSSASSKSFAMETIINPLTSVESSLLDTVIPTSASSESSTPETSINPSLSLDTSLLNSEVKNSLYFESSSLEIGINPLLSSESSLLETVVQTTSSVESFAQESNINNSSSVDISSLELVFKDSLYSEVFSLETIAKPSTISESSSLETNIYPFPSSDSSLWERMVRTSPSSQSSLLETNSDPASSLDVFSLKTVAKDSSYSELSPLETIINPSSSFESSSLETVAKDSSYTKLSLLETVSNPSSLSESSVLERSINQSSSTNVYSLETMVKDSWYSELLETSSEISLSSSLLETLIQTSLSLLEIIEKHSILSESSSLEASINPFPSSEPFVWETMVQASLSSQSSLLQTSSKPLSSLEPYLLETVVNESLYSEVSSLGSENNPFTLTELSRLESSINLSSFPVVSLLETVVENSSDSELSLLETVVENSSDSELSPLETSLETNINPSSYLESSLLETPVQTSVFSESFVLQTSNNPSSSSEPHLLETMVYESLYSEVSSLGTVEPFILSELSTLERSTNLSSSPDVSSLETVVKDSSYSELSPLETSLKTSINPSSPLGLALLDTIVQDSSFSQMSSSETVVNPSALSESSALEISINLPSSPDIYSSETLFYGSSYSEISLLEAVANHSALSESSTLETSIIKSPSLESYLLETMVNEFSYSEVSSLETVNNSFILSELSTSERSIDLFSSPDVSSLETVTNDSLYSESSLLETVYKSSALAESSALETNINLSSSTDLLSLGTVVHDSSHSELLKPSLETSINLSSSLESSLLGTLIQTSLKPSVLETSSNSSLSLESSLLNSELRNSLYSEPSSMEVGINPFLSSESSLLETVVQTTLSVESFAQESNINNSSSVDISSLELVVKDSLYTDVSSLETVANPFSLSESFTLGTSINPSSSSESSFFGTVFQPSESSQLSPEKSFTHSLFSDLSSLETVQHVSYSYASALETAIEASSSFMTVKLSSSSELSGTSFVDSFTIPTQLLSSSSPTSLSVEISSIAKETPTFSISDQATFGSSKIMSPLPEATQFSSLMETSLYTLEPPLDNVFEGFSTETTVVSELSNIMSSELLSSASISFSVDDTMSGLSVSALRSGDDQINLQLSSSTSTTELSSVVPFSGLDSSMVVGSQQPMGNNTNSTVFVPTLSPHVSSIGENSTIPYSTSSPSYISEINLSTESLLPTTPFPPVTVTVFTAHSFHVSSISLGTFSLQVHTASELTKTIDLTSSPSKTITDSPISTLATGDSVDESPITLGFISDDQNSHLSTTTALINRQSSMDQTLSPSSVSTASVSSVSMSPTSVELAGDVTQSLSMTKPSPLLLSPSESMVKTQTALSSELVTVAFQSSSVMANVVRSMASVAISASSVIISTAASGVHETTSLLSFAPPFSEEPYSVLATISSSAEAKIISLSTSDSVTTSIEEILEAYRSTSSWSSGRTITNTLFTDNSSVGVAIQSTPEIQIITESLMTSISFTNSLSYLLSSSVTSAANPYESSSSLQASRILQTVDISKMTEGHTPYSMISSELNGASITNTTLYGISYDLVRSSGSISKTFSAVSTPVVLTSTFQELTFESSEEPTLVDELQSSLNYMEESVTIANSTLSSLSSDIEFFSEYITPYPTLSPSSSSKVAFLSTLHLITKTDISSSAQQESVTLAVMASSTAATSLAEISPAVLASYKTALNILSSEIYSSALTSTNSAIESQHILTSSPKTPANILSTSLVATDSMKMGSIDESSVQTVPERIFYSASQTTDLELETTAGYFALISVESVFNAVTTTFSMRNQTEVEIISESSSATILSKDTNVSSTFSASVSSTSAPSVTEISSVEATVTSDLVSSLALEHVSSLLSEEMPRQSRSSSAIALTNIISTTYSQLPTLSEISEALGFTMSSSFSLMPSYSRVESLLESKMDTLQFFTSSIASSPSDAFFHSLSVLTYSNSDLENDTDSATTMSTLSSENATASYLESSSPFASEMYQTLGSVLSTILSTSASTIPVVDSMPLVPSTVVFSVNETADTQSIQVITSSPSLLPSATIPSKSPRNSFIPSSSASLHFSGESIKETAIDTSLSMFDSYSTFTSLPLKPSPPSSIEVNQETEQLMASTILPDNETSVVSDSVEISRLTTLETFSFSHTKTTIWSSVSESSGEQNISEPIASKTHNVSYQQTARHQLLSTSTSSSEITWVSELIQPSMSTPISKDLSVDWSDTKAFSFSTSSTNEDKGTNPISLTLVSILSTFPFPTESTKEHSIFTPISYSSRVESTVISGKPLIPTSNVLKLMSSTSEHFSSSARESTLSSTSITIGPTPPSEISVFASNSLPFPNSLQEADYNEQSRISNVSSWSLQSKSFEPTVTSIQISLAASTFDMSSSSESPPIAEPFLSSPATIESSSLTSYAASSTITKFNSVVGTFSTKQLSTSVTFTPQESEWVPSSAVDSPSLQSSTESEVTFATLSADQLISASQPEPTYSLLSESDWMLTSFTASGKGETSIAFSTESSTIVPSASLSFIESVSDTSESTLSTQVAPSVMPLLSPDTEPLSTSWYSSQLVLSSSPMSQSAISELPLSRSSQVSSGRAIVPVTGIQSAIALPPIESELISSSTIQAAVPISSLEFEPLLENELDWSATASSKPTSGAAVENPKAGLSASTDEKLVKLSSLPATTTTRGKNTSVAPTATALKPTTTPADPCKVVQCGNNGIIDCKIVDGKAKYQCRCPSGFYGDNCQSRSPCDHSRRCQNGGVCLRKRNVYRCRCRHSFHGAQCEYENTACSNNPCQNGGRCRAIASFFQCTCPAGFLGNKCQVNVSKKNCKPCLNGGKMLYCFNGIYYCFCKNTGYTGRNCERKLYEPSYTDNGYNHFSMSFSEPVTINYIFHPKYPKSERTHGQMKNFKALKELRLRTR